MIYKRIGKTHLALSWYFGSADCCMFLETAYGIAGNSHGDIVQKEVVPDDLFV